MVDGFFFHVFGPKKKGRSLEKPVGIFHFFLFVCFFFGGGGVGPKWVSRFNMSFWSSRGI